jgi:type I restriction enzyme, S subunit
MKAGWEVKTLGEVYDVRDGTHDSPKYVESGYPLITSKNLKDKGLSFENVQYITEADYNKINARSAVHRGDVLFAMIGTIGNPTIVAVEPNFAIKNVALLKVPQVQNSSFLKYYLETEEVISKMVSEAKGTTQKFVGLGYLRSFPIKIPSLSEQQRIVAILDQAYEGIAKARANAEKNLENARALFESHLLSLFSVCPELVEGRGESWINATLGQYIKFIDYRGKTPEKTEGGLRLITAKNVKMGYLQDNPREYVAPKTYGSWMTRGIPRLGDVLFTTEAPLANVAQLDTDEKVVFAQRIIIMQPDASKLDSTFLKYMLLSEPIQKRIHDKGTGATVKGIKASLLKNIQIYFPNSVPEQAKIVDKFDALSTETKRLEALYQRKIALLDELKKSLLQQAFAGEL